MKPGNNRTGVASPEKNIIGKKRVRPHQKLVRYLTNSEYEYLNWQSPFGYEGLVRIRTPTDGSCFFHAIAKSYFKPYITGKLNGNPFNRKEFIRKLREDLSVKLGSKVDPSNPHSPIYYQVISRGELYKMSKSMPTYTLEHMQKELDSKSPVDNIYNEFISDQLNKDIYILDMVKRDVYITGYDDEILYKGRPSIIILYLPGHYELVGLNNNGVIQTLFDSDDDLIRAIRARMDTIRLADKSENDRLA